MKTIVIELCKWWLGNIEDGLVRCGKLLYKWETGKNPPTMQELLRQSLGGLGGAKSSIMDLPELMPKKKDN